MAEFSTTLTADEVIFRYPDPGHELTDVKVWHHVDLPTPDGRRGTLPPPCSDLEPVPGGWEVRWPLAGLDLDRLEYEFTAGHPVFHDERTTLTDPGNPLRVEGPFTGLSWLSLSGYREPAWLSTPVTPFESARSRVAGIDVELCTPAGMDPRRPLPLLIAHDGPEFGRLGRLVQAVAALGAAGRLPALRVALLTPVDRLSGYAADPAYGEHLAQRVVPDLVAAHPTLGRPILAGPSLGGLAALHTHWRHPETFAGLLLLSGSFFLTEFDSHEAGFAHWGRLRGFVDEVYAVNSPPSPAPVALGWGTAEENRHNNLAMATQLRSVGLDVTVATRRDGHNYTCWRNLLDPLLPALAAAAWPGLTPDGLGLT